MIKEKNAVDAYFATIHMAGDINHARQICRKFVMSGNCVQLTPCEFIYTGGMEVGFTVRLMNYARFPRELDEIDSDALQLACQLCRELCQLSFTIETPHTSTYYTDDNFKSEASQLSVNPERAVKK
ncbi:MULTISPECIES: hypothetical protein [Enterobacteriaceae]|uniref:hypothetical protein n=1 Tax=Enterobacteriaceae TaxID=543 RepID=UPI000272B2E7|nr:hypothetical protein [Enterobacter sp. Ag1]EJF31744.1 hypothetical protein A936_09128 [Enterobacter sp. Ag1]